MLQLSIKLDDIPELASEAKLSVEANLDKEALDSAASEYVTRERVKELVKRSLKSFIEEHGGVDSKENITGLAEAIYEYSRLHTGQD